MNKQIIVDMVSSLDKFDLIGIVIKCKCAAAAEEL